MQPVLKMSTNSNKMPDKKLKAYSGVLVRAIQRELGEVVFFTREDLLHLKAFDHISTIYRYGVMCALVRHLVNRGDIVEHRKTDLSLKANAHLYNETSLRDRYLDTVERLIMAKIKKNVKFRVMEIVEHWVTDNDLTTNNKRVAVRGALPILLKRGIIRKVDEFEFIAVRT